MIRGQRHGGGRKVHPSFISGNFMSLTVIFINIGVVGASSQSRLQPQQQSRKKGEFFSFHGGIVKNNAV